MLYICLYCIIFLQKYAGSGDKYFRTEINQLEDKNKVCKNNLYIFIFYIFYILVDSFVVPVLKVVWSSRLPFT